MKCTHLFFALSCVLAGVVVSANNDSLTSLDDSVDGRASCFLTVKNCRDEAVSLEVYCCEFRRKIGAATIHPGETHEFYALAEYTDAFYTARGAMLSIDELYKPKRRELGQPDICLYSTVLAAITKDQRNIEIYPDKVMSVRREVVCN